jgi:uncharacterized membrane protein
VETLSFDQIPEVAHTVSAVLELVSIIIILGALLLAIARAVKWVVKGDSDRAYDAFKRSFGKGLLLGLEVLVAADLLRTVAFEPTWQNLLGLGFLVLVRTFLSWSLEVELEGHWPWQRKRLEAEAADGCSERDG